MVTYKFDKENHHHSLNDIPAMGVTTILHVIAKPALIQWSANMACDYITDHLPNITDVVIKEARTAHCRRKDTSADIGSLVHESVEVFVKTGKKYKGKDPQIKTMFQQFLEWAEANEVLIIESEKHVYSEKMWVGGILDLVFEMKGKRYIGDLKTSSGIFPEHFLQMGAYDLCLEEMGEKPVDGYMVININREGKLRTKLITNREKCRQGFLHALGLYKILQTMKWNAYY